MEYGSVTEHASTMLETLVSNPNNAKANEQKYYKQICQGHGPLSGSVCPSS